MDPGQLLDAHPLLLLHNRKGEMLMSWDKDEESTSEFCQAIRVQLGRLNLSPTKIDLNGEKERGKIQTPFACLPSTTPSGTPVAAAPSGNALLLWPGPPHAVRWRWALQHLGALCCFSIAWSLLLALCQPCPCWNLFSLRCYKSSCWAQCSKAGGARNVGVLQVLSTLAWNLSILVVHIPKGKLFHVPNWELAK